MVDLVEGALSLLPSFAPSPCRQAQTRRQTRHSVGKTAAYMYPEKESESGGGRERGRGRESIPRGSASAPVSQLGELVWRALVAPPSSSSPEEQTMPQCGWLPDPRPPWLRRLRTLSLAVLDSMLLHRLSIRPRQHRRQLSVQALASVRTRCWWRAEAQRQRPPPLSPLVHRTRFFLQRSRASQFERNFSSSLIPFLPRRTVGRRIHRP